jgi:hypothetical protein
VDEPKPAVRASDLGVVDPMGIPGLARARQWWRSLPRLVQVFVGLAALDVVVRALGLFGERLYVGGDLLAVTATFLPHDALILLPAIIVWRRPDALVSMPLVLQGAIAVALAELLNQPLRAVVSGNPQDPISGATVIAMTAAIVAAGGWVAMARGFRWFSPAKPSETIAGLANLVAGGLVLGAVISTIAALFLPNIEFGDALWNDLIRLNNAVLSLSGLGLAYLAWLVVRGTGDPTRPVEATYLATMALAALAIGSVLNQFVGPGTIWVLIYWLTHNVAMTGLVVAFGLGLADPSGTIEPAVQTEQPIPA